MEPNNLILIKGFDLFFDAVTQSELRNMSLELGGKSSFSTKEQRVTYMFSKGVVMELDKLSECHDVVNMTGRNFSNSYECEFLYSELYLSVAKKRIQDFSHDQIELITVTNS